MQGIFNLDNLNTLNLKFEENNSLGGDKILTKNLRNLSKLVHFNLEFSDKNNL